MAYNSTKGILTAPFTKIAADGDGDLQKALGTTSLSQAAMFSGSAGSINIAAKYKPFCYSAAAFSTAAERETRRLQRNCGLAMRRYTSISAVVDAGLTFDAGAFAWIYDRPKGTSASPYRALDFVDMTETDSGGSYTKGYVPGATFNGDLRFGVNRELRNALTAYPAFTFNNSMFVLNANGNVTKSDLTGDSSASATSNYYYYNIADCWHGVAIRLSTQTSGFTYAYIAETLDDVLAQAASWLNSTSIAGTYEVVFFFTSYQTAGRVTSDISASYYLMPYPHFTVAYSATFGILYKEGTTAPTWYTHTTTDANTILELTLATEAGTIDCDSLLVYIYDSSGTLIGIIDPTYNVIVDADSGLQAIKKGSGGATLTTSYTDFTCWASSAYLYTEGTDKTYNAGLTAFNAGWTYKLGIKTANLVEKYEDFTSQIRFHATPAVTS